MHPSTTHSKELDRVEPGMQRRAGLLPAATAIAVGLAILYVVGFAASQTIHDAAHDARHSLNFPCH